MRFLQKLCLFLVFIFLVIAGYRALAIPNPSFPKGLFVLQAQFEPVMKISVEKVVAINEQGRARLKEVRNSGYSCRSVGRMVHRCVLQSDLNLVTEEDVQRILKEVNSERFEFTNHGDGFDLIHEAEVYKIWRVYNTVIAEQNLWKSYEYFWSPSVEKIRLGDAGSPDAEYLVVEDSETLFQQVRVSHTFSQHKFEIRIFNVFFRK